MAREMTYTLLPPAETRAELSDDGRRVSQLFTKALRGLVPKLEQQLLDLMDRVLSEMDAEGAHVAQSGRPELLLGICDPWHGGIARDAQVGQQQGLQNVRQVSPICQRIPGEQPDSGSSEPQSEAVLVASDILSPTRHAMSRSSTLVDLSKGASKTKNASTLSDSRDGAQAMVDHGIPRCIANKIHYWIQAVQNLREPPRKGWINSFVHSTGFQQLSSVVIMFNAYESIYSAEYELNHGTLTATNAFIDASENLLFAFYMLEMILKFWVHGWYFFVNDEWKFNVFDFLLILQMVYEKIALIILKAKGSQSSNLTFMRLFRFLRIARALRLVKAVRIFDELHKLIESLGASLSSFFWMLTAIFFVVFIFALIFLQGAACYVLAEDEPTYSQETADAMRERFGSFYLCFLSTYKAGTGGQSWEVFFDLIAQAGTVYQVAFLFYIAFFSISVFNIITGMMVENVMAVTLENKERYTQRWRDQKDHLINEFTSIISQMDADNSGSISWDEFELVLDSKPELAAWLSHLDLDLKSAEHFFSVLEVITQSEQVPIDAFVDGCMHMRGQASSMDVHLLAVQLRALHEQQMVVTSEVHQILQKQVGT